ncbi:MAG: hypothetical protein JW990_04450 [Thermoleophilia bacterium]|nr:hypothetical protein [Thermoleophilia bacterium]
MADQDMLAVYIVVGVVVALICGLVAADRVFYLRYLRRAVAIRAGSQPGGKETITEGSLGDLPEPVARYMVYSGLMGRKRIRYARVFHSGMFSRDRAAGFLPIKGEYWLTADPPSFCWYGKIRMAPLLTTAAIDTYHEGRGRMLGKVMGLFKIMDEHGETTDQSSFGRMVVEMCMIPSFYLDGRRVIWTGSDGLKAECVVRDAGREATAQFSFNADGSLERVTVKRFYNELGKGEPSLELFTGIARGRREFDGLVFPEVLDGHWNLEDGDFHYVHFVIDRVQLV